MRLSVISCKVINLLEKDSETRGTLKDTLKFIFNLQEKDRFNGLFLLF